MLDLRELYATTMRNLDHDNLSFWARLCCRRSCLRQPHDETIDRHGKAAQAVASFAREQ